MNLERRALHAEFRATDPDRRMFEAKVMTYNLVDDYGTIWTPGVFTESLERRLPRIVWGHDWTDLLGRYVDYRDTEDSLTLVGEFDDFDAVPRARQAYAQLRSGTIDQFSVGFGRREWKGVDDLTPDERAIGAIERMVKADLHEASLVLVGAVPNTELIGVREVRMPNGQTVPEDFVIDLGRKIHAGQITVDEAHTALELVASGSAPTDDTDALDLDAILSEADEALER